MEQIASFQDSYFNFFDLKSDYDRRRRIPVEGKKGKHRLETGEVTVNPNPNLLQQEIQKHVEQFENMKVTYLEQETKEKFLRSIISDPPVLIEQSNVEEIEQENKQKKQKLKHQKAQVDEIQSQLESLSKQLCSDYDDLKAKSQEAVEMTEEMEIMQREIDQLTKQEEELELPALEDPDMNLPAPELNRLAEEYGKQKDEIDNALKELSTESIPHSQQEYNDLKEEISRLEQEKTTAERSAEEMVKLREQEMQKGKIHNETTAQWYKSLITILEKIWGIKQFTITPTSDEKNNSKGQEEAFVTVSFTRHDNPHQVLINRNASTTEISQQIQSSIS